MKYFLDTEFLEGTQKIRVKDKRDLASAIWLIICAASIIYFEIDNYIYMSILIGIFAIIVFIFYLTKTNTTKNTIDLISIGIVSEDGREFYEISKDFNLYEAWNRYQIRQVSGDIRNRYPNGIKEYWIRDNVILPIIYELAQKDYKEKEAFMADFGNYNNWLGFIQRGKNWEKTWYKRSKELINKYGKTNKTIAYDIKHFIYNTSKAGGDFAYGEHLAQETIKEGIEIYAYYADYDWVGFCWLFGNMIDLPEGFPMYCRDLKQMFNEVVDSTYNEDMVAIHKITLNTKSVSKEDYIKALKNSKQYPKQVNEHNALGDAKWNKDFYDYLKRLKEELQ
jgi:hypothetical protein